MSGEPTFVPNARHSRVPDMYLFFQFLQQPSENRLYYYPFYIEGN